MHKQGRQNRLWSLMPEWGNLNFDNDCIFGEMKILMASTGISNKSCKCRNTYYWNIYVYERLQDNLFSTGICCPNVCPLRIINVSSTAGVLYKFEMRTLRAHLSSLRFLCWVCVARLFSFLCCVFLFCLTSFCVLSPMLSESLNRPFLIAR